MLLKNLGLPIIYPYFLWYKSSTRSSSSLLGPLTQNGPEFYWIVIFYDGPRAVAVRRVPVITLGSAFPRARWSLLSAGCRMLYGYTVWICPVLYVYPVRASPPAGLRAFPNSFPRATFRVWPPVPALLAGSRPARLSGHKLIPGLIPGLIPRQ